MRKLCAERNELETIISKIMTHDPTKDAIVSTGISLLSFIYGDIDRLLQALRLNKYHKMAATKMVKPESLPPLTGAARQHILQYHDWKHLGSMTLSPVVYWSCIKDGKYTPIFTEDRIAPPELLKFALCNCKKGCNSSKCSCKNMGLNAYLLVVFVMAPSAAIATPTCCFL